MKNIICLILTVVVFNCVYAQALPVKHEWKVTLKVVDEAGKPIADADASVGYFSNHTGASIKGLTDTNGVFTASHSAYSGLLSFAVVKAGYYRTWSEYDLGSEYNTTKWNSLQTIILKQIGKPIAMYARKVQVEIPETNKPVGFDLVEGDWVTPYGKGKQADFIFQAERRWVGRNDFNSAVKLKFSNRGDGLVPIAVLLNQGSELRMFAKAPSEGYVPEFSKGLSHTLGNSWKDDERDGNKEQNYYLRVRTVLDAQGNAKSALYGKIYGDFALDPINSKTTWILFTYYLNPEPNSRNVEFDPKQNLFKNLKPDEGVSAP